MTPSRDFRDELPPLMQEWLDWTTTHARGWRQAPTVAVWLLETFMAVMVVGLTGIVLAAGFVVAVSGLLLKRAAKAIQGQRAAEVVPFQRRRQG